MLSLNTRSVINLSVRFTISDSDYVYVKIHINDINLLCNELQVKRNNRYKVSEGILPEPENPRKDSPLYVGIQPSYSPVDISDYELVPKIGGNRIQLNLLVPKTLEELISEREIISSDESVSSLSPEVLDWLTRTWVKTLEQIH